MSRRLKPEIVGGLDVRDKSRSYLGSKGKDSQKREKWYLGLAPQAGIGRAVGSKTQNESMTHH